MNSLVRSVLLSFLAALAATLLLRTLYAALPCSATAILCPVNDSPWEWGKAVYWPYLVAALTMWRLDRREGCRGGHCAALLCATSLMITLCKLLSLAVPIWCLWCLSMAAGMVLYALVLRRRCPGGDLLWYTLAILLGIAFLLFTAMPPRNVLFFSPKVAEAMASIPF